MNPKVSIETDKFGIPISNPSILKQTIMPKEQNILPSESKKENSGMIYHTVYKKGNVISNLHFRHEGDLESAVAKVRDYLQRHCLRHIHTVPFLVNLDENNTLQSLEEIDVS